MSDLYEYSNAGSCRSCDAAILWFRTPRGKNIPIDDNSASDMPMLSRGDTFTATEAQKIILPNTHFATCPNASRHRRSG